MATATTNSKARCFTCGKDKVVYLCKGCSQEFCIEDLPKHHQENVQELEKIVIDCDALQQNIIESKANTDEPPLIDQVNRWEKDSIEKIQRMAAECRQIITESVKDVIIEAENKLNPLKEIVRMIHQDNNFNEIHLYELKAQLESLKNDILQPRNIFIVEESTSLINKISIKCEYNQFNQT